jgi:hypothetical protein
MGQRLGWFGAGIAVGFLVFLLAGGVYTITPPNGPVDTAYKLNRITGKVWMIKTYSKQVGPVRVLAARQAEVEKTRDLGEGEVPALAGPEVPVSSSRSRR